MNTRRKTRFMTSNKKIDSVKPGPPTFIRLRVEHIEDRTMVRTRTYSSSARASLLVGKIVGAADRFPAQSLDLLALEVGLGLNVQTAQTYLTLLPLKMMCASLSVWCTKTMVVSIE